MNMDEIIGREFDWYALDKEGNIGMFAAGGSCRVPPKVFEHYEEYELIRDFIEEPNYGSEDVWQDHANIGFYVFETDMNGAPYTKRAEPTNDMKPTLKQKIMSLPNLQKYNLSFSEIDKFDENGKST